MSNQSIEEMEAQILYANPHLEHIFLNSKKLFASPVSISQISFLKKTQVEDHVLLLGDAAGMIAPLCGNGMSMALHASKIAAEQLHFFLKKDISRKELEDNYTTKWKAQFAKRLSYGRMIQYFFGKEWMTNLFVRAMNKMPALTRWLISQTHGKPF
jgi:flavin-dependent dehydrogenase